jgi:L-alanine-DL-glutamate epimerase-like enolase superfamily enzyme
MARLDLVGKACNAPVYCVLGGPTRSKVRALGPCTVLPTPSYWPASTKPRLPAIALVASRFPTPPRAIKDGLIRTPSAHVGTN